MSGRSPSRAGTGGTRDQANAANVNLHQVLGKAAGVGSSAEKRMSAAPTQSTASLLQVRSHCRAARTPPPAHPLPRKSDRAPTNRGVTQPRGWTASMPHTGERVARGFEGQGACRRGTRLAPGCCTLAAALPLRGVQACPACHAAWLDRGAPAHLQSLRRHPPHPAMHPSSYPPAFALQRPQRLETPVQPTAPPDELAARGGVWRPAVRRCSELAVRCTPFPPAPILSDL